MLNVLGSHRSITKLVVRIADGDGALIAVKGRAAWALDQLIAAGERGCTPIENPAPRWAHYAWLLRQDGIVVETVHEPHGGPYAGNHARYVLRSPIHVVAAEYEGGAQ